MTSYFETAAMRIQDHPAEVPNSDSRAIVVENGLEMIVKGPNGAGMLSDVAEAASENYVVI